MIETLKAKTEKPEQLVKAVANAVKRFVGEAEQSDDITLLAVQYKKHHGNVKFQQSIMITNDLENVSKLENFVESVCQTANFNNETTMQINLAIEEAVVNVINYAYPKGTNGMINLVAQTDDTKLKFIISDKGKAFDPTAQKDIDTDMPLDDRTVGGLGIHLIRNIMDSINYERVDGVNILTLRKKIKPESMNQ